MTPFGWLRIIGTTTLVLVLINLLVAIRSKSQGERVLREMPSSKHFDYVFLGNSTLGAGLNLETLSEASGTSPERFLKLALGGTSAEEEYLALAEFFARHNTAKCLILGFHDLHLEGNPNHSWSSLMGSFELIYFAPWERGRDVYALPAIENLKVGITRRIPILIKRANLWAKVESVRRRFAELGMPKLPVSEFGRVADFRFYPYVEEDREAAHKVMSLLAQNKAPISRPIQKIIRLCKTHQTDLIALEMPLLKERTDLCVSDPRWLAYRNFRRNSLAAQGVHYVYGFESMGNSEFFKDPVHLSPLGASLFSKRLADLIGQTPLPTSL